MTERLIPGFGSVSGFAEANVPGVGTVLAVATNNILLPIVYPFLSDAQSFIGTSDTGDSTLSWSNVDGNPIGSLLLEAASNNADDTAHWDLTGITWEDLGVPANSTITGVIAASCDYRCTRLENENFANHGGATLIDGATTIILSNSAAITGTTAWLTSNGVDSTGLSLASSNSITLSIKNDYDLGTPNPHFDIYQDNLNFIITYEVATGGADVTSSGAVSATIATTSGTTNKTLISSGVTQAATSATTGTSTKTVNSSGVVTADIAATTGNTTKKLISNATVNASTAASAGTSTTGGIVTSSAAVTAATATTTATSKKIHTSTGATVANNASTTGTTNKTLISSSTSTANIATTTGASNKTVISDGIVNADIATTSGTTLIGGVITSSANVSAEPATTTGTSTKTVNSSAATQSNIAATTGATNKSIVSSATTSAALATTAGTTLVGGIVTSSANVSADSSTSIGTSVKTVTSSAAVTAATATSTGTSSTGFVKKELNFDCDNHADFATTKTLNGDFELTVTFSTYTGACVAAGVLVGENNIAGDDAIWILANGEIRAQDSDATGISINEPFNAGNTHEIKWTRIGLVQTLHANGVLQNTRPADGLPVVFDSIGRNFAGNYFEGRIYSVLITDLETPANSISWEIDSGSTTRELSEEHPADPLKDLVYNNVFEGDWRIAPDVKSFGFVIAETATSAGADGGPKTIHPGRSYLIPPEDRSYLIPAEDRSYKIQ